MLSEHLHLWLDAEVEQIEYCLKLLPEGDLRLLGELELAGTASLIASIYHGMEKCLKQVLRHRGVTLPTGDRWHKDLIDRAAERGLISYVFREQLEDYLRFRHRFVHLYAPEVDPERIAPLVRGAPDLVANFRREVIDPFTSP